MKHFKRRVQYEHEAFLDGSFLPNRRDPDILNPPKSLSPDLKFGCVSVKTFYWAITDAFDAVRPPDYKAQKLEKNTKILTKYVTYIFAPYPYCWYFPNGPISHWAYVSSGIKFYDVGVQYAVSLHRGGCPCAKQYAVS